MSQTYNISYDYCTCIFSSALASPKFQGREGETLGHHLAHRLSDLYNNSNCIDLESLSIIPGQFCWIIYVDALVSSFISITS